MKFQDPVPKKAKRIFNGQFFSVWKKQPDGNWKVFIDHGVSHGATATPDVLSDAPLIALDLYQCQTCGHAQNLHIVDPDGETA